MEPFPGIAHGDLLKLIVSVTLILFTARVLGYAARRLGQPAVVGELLAGVLLGPAMLSGWIPALGHWLIPETHVQAQLLEVVALLGIMLLVLAVGMETDLTLIRTHARSALSIGVLGFLVPFASGMLVAQAIPDDLLGVAGNRTIFALFLSVALALSAIPVLAKILSDLKILRHRFGQVALAAGMFDDIVGWTALGLVTSLASSGRLTFRGVAVTLGAVALFFAVAVWVARPLARQAIRLTQDRLRMPDGMLTLVVVLAFALAALSQALHLEPVLGAFAAGVILSRQRRLPPETTNQLERITMGVFAPIFLGVAGLRLQVETFTSVRLLLLTAVLIAVASAGKLIGAFFGARFAAGHPIRESLAFGAALNARGVLGIIVAVIGLNMGLFGPEVYGMVVLTSLVTSLMAPVALKRLLGPDMLAPDQASQPEGRYKRALVPLRPRSEPGPDGLPGQLQLIDAIVERPATVTLMTVMGEGDAREGSRYLDRVSATLPRHSEVSKRVERGDPVTAILGEADHGYDVVLLGATRREPDADRLFEPLTDAVVRMSPCDVMIHAGGEGSWPPGRILVPTAGSRASTRAAHLALAIAGPETEVILFHVLDPEMAFAASSRHNSLSISLQVGDSLTRELRERGERDGLSMSSEMVTGPRIVEAILSRAANEVDLLIVGTHVRAGSSRLYLGPKVERLLAEAPCSTLVLNTVSRSS